MRKAESVGVNEILKAKAKADGSVLSPWKRTKKNYHEKNVFFVEIFLFSLFTLFISGWQQGS
jgi:hypothetical protein